MKLTYTQSAALVKDYEDGAAVKELAEKYGLWPNSIICRLKTAGVYRGRRGDVISSPAKAAPKRSTVISDPPPVSKPPPPRHRPAPPKPKRQLPLCPACMMNPATEALIAGQVYYLRCPECKARFDEPDPPEDPTL